MVSLVFACLFFGIWILKVVVQEKRLQLAYSPANFPLLAFMVTSVVALVWSNVFRDPLVMTWDSFPFVQIASTLVMIMLPASFLMVANHINKIKHLKIMVGLFLVGGILGFVRLSLRIKSLPIQMGCLVCGLWLLHIALHFSIMTIPKWTRVVLLGLVIFWISWGLFNFTWLTGWLPGLLILGVLTFLRSRKFNSCFYFAYPCIWLAKHGFAK